MRYGFYCMHVCTYAVMYVCMYVCVYVCNVKIHVYTSLSPADSSCIIISSLKNFLR